MVLGIDGKLSITFFQKGNFYTSCKMDFFSQLLIFLHCLEKVLFSAEESSVYSFLPHPTPYPTFISPGGMTKPSRSRQVSSTRLHAMPPIIHPSLLWLSPSKQHLLQNQPLSHTPSKLVFLSTSNAREWITYSVQTFAPLWPVCVIALMLITHHNVCV